MALPPDRRDLPRGLSGRQIVSVADTIAVGVNADGRREAVGMSIGLSEARPFGAEFLRDLVRRRLCGVKLMVSDAPEGIRAATESAAEIRTAGIVGFSAHRRHAAASEEKTMAGRPRRTHGPAFKAKVAVAAIEGEKTMIEPAQEFGIHPNQIKLWHDQLLEGAAGVFGEAPKAEPEPTIDVKTLHAKIGELALEKDFLSGARRTAR